MKAGRDDDLRWLFSRQRFGMRPGLERVGELLAALGDPQRAFRTVLVGGTNGKGATASALAAALHASGERSGLFVSPHLTRAEERFVVDGRPIAEETLLRHLRALRPHVERADATFFEAVVGLAAAAFGEAGVETAVMEVGLGGRWDATNALDPAASILTNVSLDHTEVLGPDVATIARDKAGIFRSGRPAFTAASGAGLEAVEEEAQRQRVPLEVLGRDVTMEVRVLGWRGLEVLVTSAGETLRLRTPWLGEHQAANVALAARAARVLGCPAERVVEGISAARWPGRLEAIDHRGRRVLLDGAHNPEAARSLVEAWRALGVRRPALVLGLSREKDAQAVAAVLRQEAGLVVLTRSRLSPRARPPQEMRDLFQDAVVEPDPVRALARAVRATPFGGAVTVAGSLYLIGELRPYLRGEPIPTYARWQ